MAFQTAQPPLEFIPPRFTPWVCKAAQWATPVWLHWRTGIDGFDYAGLEKLVSLMAQFEQGQVRLLLAFRHPTANDPLCLMQLFGHDLPRAAWLEGRAIKGLSHFHFVYDRGIPLWAGDFVGWLYSRLGGVPIHRGRVDVQGLRSARKLLVEGQFPLAAAPEGATNGHGEIVSPIESGVSQLGVWAVQDLRKAERNETVLILPIGIRYRYGQAPWPAIDRLLGQLEQDCGLDEDPGRYRPSQLQIDALQTDEIADHRYGRLFRLANHALALMEDHYRRYHPSLATLLKPVQTEPVEASSSSEVLFERLQRLLETALTVTEATFNIQPKGSLANRCRRLEQAGWDRIYREDIDDLAQLSAVERGLADRVAAEAQMQLWHMRLVESFVAVTGRYVREKPTAERFAESALLLDNLFAQLKGARSRRSQLGRRQVKMTIGEPLSATAVYDQALAAGEGRSQAGRTAVAELNQQLQQALERMV